MKLVEGSFKPTGEKTMSWSGRIVPEYIGTEKCERCGKTKTSKFISSADEGEPK